MKKLTLSVLPMFLLAACDGPGTLEESRTASVAVSAINVNGSPARCLKWSDLSLSKKSSNELKGELRTRFLTPEADAAGVRAFVAASDVSNYGSTIVYYTDASTDCLMFAETLGMQEYTIKAGLDPMVVTSGYTRTPAPTASPAPAPSPEATATGDEQ